MHECAHSCSRWIVSIASVESTDARFVTLVTQFWASAAVVDEPVAHLSHADAGCLIVLISRNQHTCVVGALLTLEKMAFWSSEG